MQAAPRAALEVIEAEFLFELLMCLLARPACLDRGSEALERRRRGVVREVVLHLVWTPFGDEPCFFTWQVDSVFGLGTIGNAHAHSDELRCEVPSCLCARRGVAKPSPRAAQ